MHSGLHLSPGFAQGLLFSRERERRVLVVYAFPWGCGSSSAGCRTIEKSKENLRFFNIFSLEASKTNGFSTFSAQKLQQPKVFQWFSAWGGQPEPTGLGRASRAKLSQQIRPGRARQEDLWSLEALKTMGFPWSACQRQPKMPIKVRGFFWAEHSR